MTTKKPADTAYKRMIRAAVRGQIRSFLHDHPEFLSTAPDWKREEVLNSIAKRIEGELFSDQMRDKIASALALPEATSSRA